MKRASHTHRGHCQACGRVQAIETGREPYMPRAPLAKHGYSVQWGYFSGTCAGSGVPALEFDRSVTDRVRVELLAWATKEEERAAALQARTATPPESVVTGSKCNPAYAGVGRGVPRFIDERTPWAELSDAQRDRWYDNTQRECERNARHAHDHRRFLFELIERVHGKEPQRAEHHTPEAIEPGMVFKLYDREWKVREIVYRGMGGRTRYAVCERTDGQTLTHAAIRELISAGKKAPVEFHPLTVNLRTIRERKEKLL